MTLAPRIDSIENTTDGLQYITDNQVILEKMDAPYTTINNRAQMVNYAALCPMMGINRIQTQEVFKIDEESGPNGEPVYGVVNDKWGQIRFVGTVTSYNVARGQLINISTTGDFVEIVFWGTGLNALISYVTSDNRGFNVTVDGISQPAVDLSSLSNVLINRNYSPHHVVNIVSGLSAGWHTAILTKTTDFDTEFSGFEILNESSTIDIPAGSAVIDGKLVTTASTQSLAYNPLTGSNGGRVITYLPQNGIAAQTYTEVGTASTTLANVDHSNEEVIRTYYWREFGASRSDDFSLVTSSSDVAFTLDDGTTTLVGDDVYNLTGASGEGLRLVATGDTFTFTFVGTGLDIYGGGNNGAVSTETFTIAINGTNIATNDAVFGTTAIKNLQIASNLPYGTHTVKVIQTGSTGVDVIWNKFIIYGPKKPTLPANTIELGDYNVMADFVTNDTAGLETIATGVLRKCQLREHIYTGTWQSATITPTYICGGSTYATTASNQTVSYTFFGTGFEHRLDDNANTTLNFTINGSSNLSSYTTGFYGSTNATFTASTGVYVGTASMDPGGGIYVYDMPLGLYTVEIEYAAGSTYIPMALDIITPIHTHKNNGPHVVQNTLLVGSQGVLDTRPLPQEYLDPNGTSKNKFVVSGDITLGAKAPLEDMMTTIYTTSGKLWIEYTDRLYGTAAMYLYIDGVEQDTEINSVSDTLWIYTSKSWLVNVSPGEHTIQIHGYTSGSGKTGGGNRSMRIHELK